MWKILEGREARRVLDSLPHEILKRYEKWKEVLITSGPLGLRRIKGFRDEGLKGRWFGFRSSRLNIQYRVIYKVIKTEVTVLIIKITPHDYR